jgi:hypothetical protein
MVLEGTKKVSETATFAAGGTGNAFHVPSALVDLPSNVAAGEAALLFGSVVVKVGKEGLTVAALAAAAGALLYLEADAAIPGGAVLGTTSSGGAVAVVDAPAVGGILTVRLLANV